MTALEQQVFVDEGAQHHAPKAFVTGGSGFVGSALIPALRAKGYEVAAMARSEKSMAKVSSYGAVPIKCDLSDVAATHLTGAGVVIHCAAYTEEWGSDDKYYEINVQGTVQLVAAAKAAGVKRFINVGTEAALFDGHDLNNVDETYPYALDSPFPYPRTKALGEKIVLEANADDFTTISIRPRFVWGPGDETVLPVLLELVEKKEFAWVSGGNFRTSTTYIDNLVHGLILALTNGRGGEAYFVADEEETTLREFLTAYMATRGVTPPDRSLPRIVAVGSVRILDRVWKWFNINSKPPVVRFTLEMLAIHCTVNTSKAKKELGYKPVMSAAEGFRVTTEAGK